MALAVREQIVEAINRNYGLSDGESADSMLQEFTDTAIDFTETALEQDAAAAEEDQSDAPVVKLVNLIITEAVQLRASDIHIEPFEDRVRIRYRIDGRLVERDNPPRRLLGAILSRIKILSKLDIAERRRPQDGRIKLIADGKDYDLRVSVLLVGWRLDCDSKHGEAAARKNNAPLAVCFRLCCSAVLLFLPPLFSSSLLLHVRPPLFLCVL
jgi:type IV pilus assembly protein PilB